MTLSCEIPRWQLLKQELTNLGPLDFKDRIETDKNAVLLDVRTMAEFAEGSLPGAIHLDYLAETFLEDLEFLDRSKNYYLICRTGRRSVRTGILMRNWGFNSVVNLDGGLTAWSEELGTLKDKE